MLTPKLASLCCVVLGLAVFAYSVARVSLTSFNNDESITYLYFVRSSVNDIVNYNSRFLPTNNHLLNSLLMKLSSYLFGPSEVALRLPNLLAHILYITSSFLIVRRYVATNLMPFGFLLLNLNPYMLEFFSLARGYGLALGFMMCSIYFCLRYLESRERGPLNVFLASLFAGLSLLSSFPFANYYLGMCVVIGVITLSRLTSCPSGRLALALRNGFPLVVTSLIFIMISAPPMLKLRQMMPSLRQIEGFVVGGKVGFWEDTVLSLIRSSLYRQAYADALVTPLAIILTFMVAVGGGLFLYGMWRQWFDQRLALTVVAVPITLTIAASSILQHHLLGVEYLKDRIAVMFVPLVSLVILASTTYLASAGKPPMVRSAGVLVLSLFTLGACVHALKSFNVTHSLVLRGNASTKQMLDDLTTEYQAARQQGFNGRLGLGMSVVYRPTVDYYTVSRRLTWLRPAGLQSPEASYVYYRPEDEPVVSGMNLTPLTVYPITDAVLAKKG